MNKIENLVEVLKEILNQINTEKHTEKQVNDNSSFIDAVTEVFKFNCDPQCQGDCECEDEELIGVEDFETEELFDEVYRRVGYEGILRLLDKSQQVHRFGTNWKDKG